MFSGTVAAFLTFAGLMYLLERFSGSAKSKTEVAELIETSIDEYKEKLSANFNEEWSYNLVPFESALEKQERGYRRLTVKMGDGLELTFYSGNHLDLPGFSEPCCLEFIGKKYVKISYDRHEYKVPHVVLAMAYELDREGPDEHSTSSPHPLRSDTRFDV